MLLLLLGQLDVVWHRVGVSTVGANRKLVVIGSMGLEHLYDEEMLPLEGDGHGGAFQVVQESGIGKDVKKMTCTLSSSLPAGQEQWSLTLCVCGREQMQKCWDTFALNTTSLDAHHAILNKAH